MFVWRALQPGAYTQSDLTTYLTVSKSRMAEKAQLQSDKWLRVDSIQ